GLLAAADRDGLLADHADDHLGFLLDLPLSQQLLARRCLRRADRRGDAVGRAVPRPARLLALLPGGALVAEPRQPLLQPADAGRACGLAAGDGAGAGADRRPAGDGTRDSLLSLLDLQPWAAARRLLLLPAAVRLQHGHGGDGDDPALRPR